MRGVNYTKTVIFQANIDDVPIGFGTERLQNAGAAKTRDLQRTLHNYRIWNSFGDGCIDPQKDEEWGVSILIQDH